MNNKLRDIMSELFGIEKEKIGDQTSMDNTATWDSLRHLRLIALLEERFCISIEIEDMIKMTNFANIRTSIEKALRIKRGQQ